MFRSFPPAVFGSRIGTRRALIDYRYSSVVSADVRGWHPGPLRLTAKGPDWRARWTCTSYQVHKSHPVPIIETQRRLGPAFTEISRSLLLRSRSSKRVSNRELYGPARGG